ncbi:MAG: amidohydrolase family protein [Streptosporangiales bacterium]|nr:amidohydrolase family protein [Streptosporangiales bacterium]
MTEPRQERPHPNPKRPDIALPPRACDSHCHIFGPSDRFPYAPGRSFTSARAVPEPEVRARQTFLGFERAVIVHSSCHGADHSSLLDALATGAGRYRGVALLGPDTAPEEVARLHDAGVRGVRLHFMPHLGTSPTSDEIDAIVRLVQPYGWHVAIHLAGNGVAELYDVIAGIEAPVVIDHMARVDLRQGLDSEAARALLRLLDTGGVWVKLSGADRVTLTGPPYADAVALARRLAVHAPERVVWGTDFPHPNIHGPMPDDGALVDLLAEIAPSEGARRKILVDNPDTLFFG